MVLPLIFDPQVNGYAGVDFQDINLTEDEALYAVQQMRLNGFGRVFWTLITDDWGRLLQKINKVRNWKSKHPKEWELVAGWHIEGPFLSDASGFRGAHPWQYMRDPELWHLHELKRATGSDPALITLAPERRGSLAFIDLAKRLGYRTSMGHCNPTIQEYRNARQQGIAGFTHLGNGCPAMLDRSCNNIWTVLDEGGVRIGLIPDGYHLAPALFRLIRKAYNPRLIYLTTDAMAAAGMGSGKYQLGGLEVEVGEDQVVRMPGTRQFAGSALTPMDGILRAALMWKMDPVQIWPHVTSIPGRWLGVDTEHLKMTGQAYCHATVLYDTLGNPEGMAVTVFSGGKEINSMEVFPPAEWGESF